MKRPFLISAYIVSAALFIFYIWVLWNARTPEVNLAYRMYYINRELEKWPGIEGFDYVVGIPVYMNQEQKRCGSGWEDRNNLGRRISSVGAWIYFDGLPEDDLRLTIVVDDIGKKNILTVLSNREETPLTLEKGRENGEREQLWTASIKAENGEISLLINGTEDVWVKEITIDEASE